jgi:hypothetical protein
MFVRRACPPGFWCPDSLVQFGSDYITGPQPDRSRYLPGAARKSPAERASAGRCISEKRVKSAIGGKLRERRAL